MSDICMRGASSHSLLDDDQPARLAGNAGVACMEPVSVLGVCTGSALHLCRAGASLMRCGHWITTYIVLIGTVDHFMAKSHSPLALHISLACITTVALVIWLGFKSYTGSVRHDLEPEYSWIGDNYPLLWPLPESDPVVLYPEDQHRYTMYGPNSKAEWAALVPGNGTVQLGPHGRTFSIAMFHQLKCLDIIREAMVHTEVEVEDRDPVVDHCVNYLRQIVLCHAHTTIESVRSEVGPHVTDTTRMGYVCQNWRLLYDAAKEN